jgi:membrane fusion protein YbhG
MRVAVRQTLLLSGLLAGIAAGIVLYWSAERARLLPEGLLQTSGRIEGDTVLVASEVQAHATEILAHEGDTVRPGQVLARLHDRAAAARLAGTQAAGEVVEARTQAARAALETLRKEVPVLVAQAEANLAAAQASLRQAESSERQARREVDRSRELVTSRVIDRQAAERAELSWKQARDGLDAARAALEQARQSLENASLGPQRIAQQEAEIAALQAGEREAAAAVAEAQAVFDDMTVVSPSSGTITERLVDLGEVVNPGTPMFELVDLDRLYLKVYVPEREIGRLRLGLPAKVYTDAFPDQPFDAELRTIASQAEFTPKEVQTTDERIKLVYAAKLYLVQNPEHRLTPGLPADAVIRWKEGVPWTRPRF